MTRTIPSPSCVASRNEVSITAKKEYTCDLGRFTAEMHEKYPDHVKILGSTDEYEGETLDTESMSNTIALRYPMGKGTRRRSDAEMERIKNEKLAEWSELGKVRIETWEQGKSDESIEGFLKLKDPCDEKMLKKAINEDFLWEG